MVTNPATQRSTYGRRGALLLGHVFLIVSTSALKGPCDILQDAGNPCVAAHSSTRALYAAYDGPLYNVTRASDGKSLDIGVVSAGGIANAKAQEVFCSKLDCVISNIYDQSPQRNHLYQRISDGVVHKMVNASRHKIIVHGGEVFGMWFDPGHGYHIDDTTGVAKGNEPESIYAVMSGKNFNDRCCFDYGNSENTRLQPVHTGDYACGAMEAIYLGNAHWLGNTGFGKTGPWIGADMEAGMYYGGGNATKINPMNKPIPFDFVSLHLKGRTDGFALKAGDATQGPFQTMYDGPRPTHASAPNNCHWHGVNGSFQPMRKQGAIILGTGGDNSNGASGNFYEGYIATGVTSTETDNAIKANIVAVDYKFIKAEMQLV